MIDGRNVFHQPVKNNLIKYDNNPKITTGQEDDYTTGCSITIISKKQNDGNRFKKITNTWCWSKSNTTNFTRNLFDANNRLMFLIIEEPILVFSQGTVKVLSIYFALI